MTTEYPDAITTTAEEITAGFSVTRDGEVSMTVFAVCAMPVGAIRINISPQQADEIYRSLHGICNMTPEQTADLAAQIAAKYTEEN